MKPSHTFEIVGRCIELLPRPRAPKYFVMRVPISGGNDAFIAMQLIVMSYRQQSARVRKKAVENSCTESRLREFKVNP